MSYIAPDKPELYTTLALGATHTLSALMLVVYTVIIGTEIGLSDSELRGFVALEIVVMGIATLLQSQTTRFSSGHLIVHSPSVISMGAFITAASQFGLSAAAGGLILSALVIIMLARLLPRLQTLFPPEVAGVMLVLLGLSLVERGVQRFTGLDGGHIDVAAVASPATTLLVIVIFSVWGGKRARVFAVVGGTLAGLVAVTGVAARRVGTAAALLLILMAFFPQVSAFIIQVPLPVVGAIIVYTAGYMLVLGMELILSRMLNSRRTFMVGLSITVGASLMLIPELGNSVPTDIKPILTSPLTMGGLAAIGLNLLFRIGISETASIELSGTHTASEATRFLEDRGADWGARKDVISRAGAAVGEALEALQINSMSKGPITLCASFDEFKLVLTLEYEGQAFSLTKQKMDISTLLTEDSDSVLDDAMSRMSSHLIRNLANKVSSTEQSGFARLTMQFAH
jgi:xanthine/uracil permease